jgi:hypothetical protein
MHRIKSACWVANLRPLARPRALGRFFLDERVPRCRSASIARRRLSRRAITVLATIGSDKMRNASKTALISGAGNLGARQRSLEGFPVNRVEDGGQHGRSPSFDGHRMRSVCFRGTSPWWGNGFDPVRCASGCTHGNADPARKAQIYLAGSHLSGIGRPRATRRASATCNHWTITTFDGLTPKTRNAAVPLLTLTWGCCG